MKLKELILARTAIYRLVSSTVDRPKQEAIKLLAGDASGRKVLDLGCGIGNSAGIFLRSDYTGIDINPRYVVYAARRYPGLNFIAGDANRLPWGEGFDIVLINSFLHHLDDREALAILKKAGSALNPSGRVIIQEPLLTRREGWPGRLARKLDRGGFIRPLEDWKALAEVAGLAPDRTDFYPLRILGLEAYRMVSMALVPVRD